MVQLPSLYSHQEVVRDRLRHALGVHRRVILAAEPGFGKTRLSKWVLGASVNKQGQANQTGNVLFAVYGRNLVDNASDSFNEEPVLPHGRIMAGREIDWKQRVQVGSIDTLLSWFCEDGYSVDITFDLIVYDETHAHFSKFKRFLELHDEKRKSMGLPPTFVVGLSATPEAKGLADVYGTIVKGPTTEWLIENGYLSRFRYIGGKKGDLGKLVRRGLEYTKDSVSSAMEGLAGDLVRDWKEHAQGRPTVGFFPRRSHAMEACKLLQANGVKAEYVDGETEDHIRQSLFKSLDKGHFDYLCNVGVVERGTNIPAISCVQLCTCIGSVVRYRQMIGRGSRTSEGKTDTLVIDHGGNTRHGFFEDDIEWLLDDSRSSEKEHRAKPTIECPNCKRIYRGGRCMQCEYEPTKDERKSQGLEFDGSKLVEINRKEKKEPEKQSCERLLVSSLYAANHRGGTWRQALAIAYQKAEKQKTRFRVPKEFEVGGRVYKPVERGSMDATRRLKHVYDFLK